MDDVKKKLKKYGQDYVLKSEEEELFQFYRSGRILSSGGVLGFRPQADMFETAEHLEIIFSIPFIDPKEIETIITAEKVIVRGVRDQNSESNKKRHYYKMEIDFGSFERVITIPTKVQAEDYTIDYINGFLIIKIKKIVKGA